MDVYYAGGNYYKKKQRDNALIIEKQRGALGP